MTPFIKRPSAIFNPGAGLLRTDHFQMAYATNDLERARGIFRSRFGIREFKRLEGPLPTGGQVCLDLAWVGTIMYELISASGPGSELFVDRLAKDGSFSMRHHHLGFLIHNLEQWDALMATIERDAWTMPRKSHTPGFMRTCFVDVPELGHYFEYIFPEQAGLNFFESVPAI